MALTVKSTCDQALLEAEHELWRTTFSYIKSMALKSALDLRLADAIHHHGGAATLPQIVARATVHPSKIPCLRRLMRTLTVSGVFSVVQQQDVVYPATSLNNGTCNGGGAEPLYALTPVSRLLVGSRNLASIITMLLSPNFVTPFLGIGAWFEHSLPDPCIFTQTHGEALWKMADHDATFDALINDAMVSDSCFIMDIAIRECGEVFQGISSLMDVGGGLGAAAQAISKAFPRLECTVMDLGHVVAKAPAGTDVKYVAGDMFESIPPADAVFLKICRPSSWSRDRQEDEDGDFGKKEQQLLLESWTSISTRTRVSCGLFVLRCIEYWDGEKWTSTFDQDEINESRSKILAELIFSEDNIVEKVKNKVLRLISRD